MLNTTTIYTEEQLSTFSPEELIQLVLAVQTKASTAKTTRKDEALALLQQRPYTITQLAELMQTTTKNVSSALSAIRRENIYISTNIHNYKFLTDHSYPDIDPLKFTD